MVSDKHAFINPSGLEKCIQNNVITEKLLRILRINTTLNSFLEAENAANVPHLKDFGIRKKKKFVEVVGSLKKSNKTKVSPVPIFEKLMTCGVLQETDYGPNYVLLY